MTNITMFSYYCVNVQILSRDVQCEHRVWTGRELLHGSFPVTLHLPNRAQGHGHRVAWICDALRHPILDCERGQFLLRPGTRPRLCVALPYPGPWRQWHDAPLQCHPLEILSIRHDTSSGLEGGSANLDIWDIYSNCYNWFFWMFIIDWSSLVGCTQDEVYTKLDHMSPLFLQPLTFFWIIIMMFLFWTLHIIIKIRWHDYECCHRIWLMICDFNQLYCLKHECLENLRTLFY